MSVQLKDPPFDTVNIKSLIFGQPLAERNILRYIIRYQADAMVENMLECHEDFGGELTRQVILQHLANIKTGARDMISEMLHHLELQLNEDLDRAIILAKVTSMQFDPVSDLLENVDVALEVKFGQ